MKKIAIIGFGHIGKAFYKGLINSGFKKENILTSNGSATNRKIAGQADWIIIAVKPLVVGKVIDQIKDVISNKIVISFACGVSISSMQKFADNNKQKIIRMMPNIPIVVGNGTIGFFANKNVSSQEKREVIGIFSKLGKVIECKKEEDLDAMTILSGSGPAVVSCLISMLSKSGEKFGLEKNVSDEIALQTFFGTLSYLQKTKQKPLELEKFVATKGGTTEAIIKGLDSKKTYSGFVKSLEKGYIKIKKMNEDKK